VSRRVQAQQTDRPVRESEETDDGGDRPPTTLIESGDRSAEIRAQEAADDEEIQAAQDVRRRELEEREPRPGDRVDIRAYTPEGELFVDRSIVTRAGWTTIVNLGPADRARMSKLKRRRAGERP